MAYSQQDPDYAPHLEPQKGTTLKGLSAAWVALTGIVIILRFWSRATSPKRKFGLDDWAALASWVRLLPGSLNKSCGLTIAMYSTAPRCNNQPTHCGMDESRPWAAYHRSSTRRHTQELEDTVLRLRCLQRGHHPDPMVCSSVLHSHL